VSQQRLKGTRCPPTENLEAAEILTICEHPRPKQLGVLCKIGNKRQNGMFLTK
jgi:hypothetical protein